MIFLHTARVYDTCISTKKRYGKCPIDADAQLTKIISYTLHVRTRIIFFHILLKCYESEGWGFEFPSGRDVFGHKKWHFHINIRPCVEQECCCPLYISNIIFTLKIFILPEPVLKKIWDSKCHALIAQMVRIFARIRRLGVRVSLWHRMDATLSCFLAIITTWK